MADDRSTKQIDTLDALRSGVANDPKRKPARFTLSFATWRHHLAAPGSRFEPARPVSTPIVHLEAVRRAAEAQEAERRPA